MTRPLRRRLAVACLLGLTAAAGALGCGIGIRRDLSSLPPGRVGYDDLCGVQGYFDQLAVRPELGPKLEVGLETAEDRSGRALGGRAVWRFDKRFARSALLRVLRRNYERLPAAVLRARVLELEVVWADLVGTRRVVRGEAAELRVRGHRWSLPYHPCLSELLYGEPLYSERRRLRLGGGV